MAANRVERLTERDAVVETYQRQTLLEKCEESPAGVTAPQVVSVGPEAPPSREQAQAQRINQPKTVSPGRPYDRLPNIHPLKNLNHKARRAPRLN